MNYNHVPVDLKELTTETINRKRFYVTPEGNKYPSITTVLSVRNKKGLFEWRKRVGEQVANHIARTAAARGTKVHHMCEDYLNNMHNESPEDGTVQEFIKNKDKYLPMLEETVTEWSVQNETPILVDGDVSDGGLSNNSIV